MCEPLFYIILGSVLAIGVFWVAGTADEDHPKKKKQSDPTSCSAVIGKILLLPIAVMGICFLFFSVGLAVDLYEDWSEYRLLNEKGETRTVPLLRVEKDSGGRKTVYEAAYEFNGSAREQMISKSQYERLRSQDSVEILVYDNASMIVGSKPKYDLILAIMLMGAFGVLIVGAMMIVSFQAMWQRLGRRIARRRDKTRN